MIVTLSFALERLCGKYGGLLSFDSVSYQAKCYPLSKRGVNKF